MKKILSIISISVILFSCSSSDNNDSTDRNKQENPAGNITSQEDVNPNNANSYDTITGSSGNSGISGDNQTNIGTSSSTQGVDKSGMNIKDTIK